MSVPEDEFGRRFGPVGVALRGLLMGIAEVVPGVSGGTIALVTGIYTRLIGGLASFGPASLLMLRQPLRFAEHHQLGFFVPLALGMAAGVLLFAAAMRWLIEHYPTPVWGFFCGVILASVVAVGTARSVRGLASWGVLGLVLGFGLILLPTYGGTHALPVFFAAGMIAVSAWILPAVSGSYMLLVMGLYEPVLEAISEFDWTVLLTLGLGCAAGLMAFVRLLKWLLARFAEPLLSFLTGFMLGSVANLWPWQNADATGLASLVMPAAYEAASGEPARIWATLVAVLVGGLALQSIARKSL